MPMLLYRLLHRSAGDEHQAVCAGEIAPHVGESAPGLRAARVGRDPPQRVPAALLREQDVHGDDAPVHAPPPGAGGCLRWRDADRGDQDRGVTRQIVLPRAQLRGERLAGQHPKHHTPCRRAFAPCRSRSSRALTGGQLIQSKPHDGLGGTAADRSGRLRRVERRRPSAADVVRGVREDKAAGEVDMPRPPSQNPPPQRYCRAAPIRS